MTQQNELKNHIYLTNDDPCVMIFYQATILLCDKNICKFIILSNVQ